MPGVVQRRRTQPAARKASQFGCKSSSILHFVIRPARAASTSRCKRALRGPITPSGAQAASRLIKQFGLFIYESAQRRSAPSCLPVGQMLSSGHYRRHAIRVKCLTERGWRSSKFDLTCLITMSVHVFFFKGICWDIRE